MAEVNDSPNVAILVFARLLSGFWKIFTNPSRLIDTVDAWQFAQLAGG